MLYRLDNFFPDHPAKNLGPLLLARWADASKLTREGNKRLMAAA
jgi:hypothetical protein